MCTINSMVMVVQSLPEYSLSIHFTFFGKTLVIKQANDIHMKIGVIK